MKSLAPLIFMLVFAGLGCRLDASTPLPNQASSSTTAEQWLGIVEKRLEGIRSIMADLQLEKVEGIGVLDEKEMRKGRIVFTTGPPAKFSIHLVQLLIDQRPQKQNQWYIFDGRWLVDRDDNEKIFTKREIVPPDKTASDPLADGDGPFFLPITVRKDLILKHFDVSIISPTKKDPTNSIHMRMTPKPTRRTEVKQIDVWYHSITCLPIRASTLDDGPNRQTVDLSNVKLNEKVDPKLLDVSVPKGNGWHKTVEPYPHH